MNKLMEYFRGFFSHKQIDSKIEIEPANKVLMDPDMTQVVDDMPVGYYHTSIDSHGSIKKDDQKEIIKSLLRRYRRMALISEVDEAIDIIINEMVVPDDNDNIVSIDLKNIEMPEKINKKISQAFEKIITLMNFNKDAYDICRRWYVDGRQHFNVVIDKEKPIKGIQKLIYIDAMDVFLNRELKTINEFRYFWDVLNKDTNKMIDTHLDLVAYVGSGKFDRVDNNNPIEISYLHKAFKPMNHLKNIEDSIVISRLIRASDKRVFTVNTGMLNKKAAEAYMEKLINKFRNKLVYNVDTGEVDVYKNVHSMVEDFWFAENSQGKGTKLDIHEGMKGLGDLDDLYYFKDVYYDSLKIPQSRRNLDREKERAMFSTSAEIERDEISFHKMIRQLRNRYSQIFLEFLKRELIWTKVLNRKDFEKIKNKMRFVFNNDNLYEEMKESAILQNRLTNLQGVEPYIGKYFTNDDIAYSILKFSEEEWKEKQKDFKKNKEIYDMMGDEEDSNFSVSKKEKEKEKENNLIDKYDDEEEDDDENKERRSANDS